jgi:hypothetical protein
MKRRRVLTGLAATVPGLAPTARGPFRPDWDSLGA